MGEAGAVLPLTAAAIRRTVQDLIKVQQCCPWQVVPQQDISKEWTDREERQKRVERGVKE